MSLINFESSREKEKKRQWEREARNAILEKAKNKYESDILKEEARKQRGEHTWMLPSVESKLDSAKQEKKKKKKEKKKKKKKAKKKKDSSSSSSSESDEEGETWVEKQAPEVSKDDPSASNTQNRPVASQETSKRDDWMEMTSLFKTYSRDEIRDLDGNSRKKEKEEEKRRKQEADKPGSHARELNPYYKDGGTGLPEENNEATSTLQSSSLGLDASWLRKALQRAKEQAELENVTLEEVAARRWGSLEKFNELLAQAEGRGKREDKWKNKQMQHSYRNRSRSRERRSSRSRERKRSTSRGRKRSGSRDRKRSRSRDRYRSVSKERKRSRDRKRSKSRDRKRSRSRERRRSRSNERQKYKGKDEGKDESRHNRSESKEKSQENMDAERRNRSKDKRSEGKYRRRYSNSSDSSHSSRSSSSSSSDSHDGKKNSSQIKKQQYPVETSCRPSSSLMKPPGDERATQKSSLLSSKFHKPGEHVDSRRHGAGIISRGSSISGRGWQKKQYIKEEQMKMQNKSKSSSSSSSSPSESESEGSDKDSPPVEDMRKKVPVSSDPTEGTPSEKPVLLTDKEMNELAAKIMKAELVGNDNMANKLKNKLEAARTARANAPPDIRGSAGNQDGAKEQLVILTRTDAKGFSRPVSLSDAGEGKKKQGKTITHGKDGKRNKYFPDDDKYNLKQMFEAEKSTSAEDQNSMFNRAAMQNHEKLNDDYDMDDMFMSKAALKESSAKQAERDRKRAIQEHQRCERSLESCQWCFDNKEMAKHLIVALGTKAYICLPPHESLTSGHCLIVPVHHVMSSIHADEDLWAEIMSFRKSLVKMFNSREEDCIFFETVKRLRNFPHMTLHCVPLPKEMGDMAPIYFKKAIMECEAEWAQNKKLVELKNRDVRKAVPKGLPYFFVDFAMDPGFAHVIEDEQNFPSNFAQEIVGGMLDLETNLWRKPRKENFDAQRKKVMEFSRWYKDFDITQDEKD